MMMPIPHVDPAAAEVVLVKVVLLVEVEADAAPAQHEAILTVTDRARAEAALAHRVVAVARQLAVSLAALHPGAVRVADEVTRIAEVAGPAVRRNVERT